MPNPRGQLSDPTELTAGQALEVATTTLQAHLPLVFASPLYEPDDIWRVLVLAAAQGRSIDSAPADLASAPSASTVRYQLLNHLFADLDLVTLEQKLNAALVSQLPGGLKGTRQRIACDLTLVPYHGEPFKDSTRTPTRSVGARPSRVPPTSTATPRPTSSATTSE